MTPQKYNIILDNTTIGTTELEKADAPMGVVFGRITFAHIVSGYDFFKNYCLQHGIGIPTDYPEDKLLATNTIPNLKIIKQNGVEIKGLGASIDGMDSDFFVVTIVGISSPFFAHEFPYHVQAYNEQFKSTQ